MRVGWTGREGTIIVRVGREETIIVRAGGGTIIVRAVWERDDHSAGGVGAGRS